MSRSSSVCSNGKLELFRSSPSTSTSISTYSVPLLLLLGITLKSDDDNNEKYKETMKSLTLEPRPTFSETVENSKSYSSRFGSSGFTSRGSRNSQRGRITGNQLNNMNRRSGMKSSNDNLWDMPCSEMCNMTLGDIREAESRMKAEDLTLDQFVEKQKESNEKRGILLSQINQTNNMVSIPISNDSSVNINNTLSMNNTNRDHQDQFYQCCNQKDVFQSKFNVVNRRSTSQNLGISNSNFESINKEPKRSLPIFPTTSQKKSSISETFLKGPANLSLFDVNTPIFDDDNNDSVVDFRPPLINNNGLNNSINNGNNDNSINTNNNNGIINNNNHSSSSFSWSTRNNNNDDIDNKNSINFSNLSTSFPVLSKNSQIPQSSKTSDNSILSESNFLQKLQAAGISSKFVDNNKNTYTQFRNNMEQNRFNQLNYTDAKIRQHVTLSSEYPPLSSASNINSSNNNSINLRNNQVRTNDAGRLLMSIIGAGQQNNSNKSNLNNFTRY